MSSNGWAELWISRIGISLFAAGMLLVCLNLVRDVEIWGAESGAQQSADDIAAAINRVIKHGGSDRIQLKGISVRIYPDGLELIQGNRSYFSEFISKVYLIPHGELESIWNECSRSSNPRECLESKSVNNISPRSWIQAISFQGRLVLVSGE